MAEDINWDDLRFVLEVARAGSAIAAARKMKVNASTVQRRIAGFEKTHGVRLFERRHRGLFPTGECADVIAEAEQMEERVLAIRRDILGSDLRLKGVVRLTTTETFMGSMVARHISNFQRDHPDIDIEITLTNTRLNLSRQDADIAIRPSKSPHETLVGQRVAGLAFAAYGLGNAAAHLPPQPSLDELASCKWVGIGEALSGAPASDWMRNNIPYSSIALTVDTFPAILTYAVQGVGLAILPCILGDAEERLRRFELPGETIETSVWVLTHPEIRNAARIRAFMDHMSKALRGERVLLEGRTA